MKSLGTINDIDKFISNELEKRKVRFIYLGMGRFSVKESDRHHMVDIKNEIELIKKGHSSV